MMVAKKECVAMLLAGGQGSRLTVLTEKNAKPAVTFGGKYRIIDFPLSNCIHSGIDTVGVLTQYQPLMLNEYIGNGQPWDLDRQYGGVMVLPPYQGKSGGDFYRGTANAIYQNLPFIDRYDPDYVLVLSGDHIYKMNYAKMLSFHKEKNADATIAVINVPREEAPRFGIMVSREDGRITRFEEKPAHPSSTTASMGIYIFNRRALEDYLLEDEGDPQSDNDFGKNIIPAMLRNGAALYSYPFSGYWKDVGTLESLWEANMDLLGPHPRFNLFERNHRIYSRTYARPPQFVGPAAVVRNAIVTEGCEIYGRVENSVLSGGVYVAPGAVVRDAVLMQDVRVLNGARVEYAIVDGGSVIGAGALVGAPAAPGAQRSLAVVRGDTEVCAGAVVPPGATLAPQS